MVRLKCVVLLALVVCCTMQVVVSQTQTSGDRRRERGLAPEEEERRAKEEDYRRRGKAAEEERRHQRQEEGEEEEEEEEEDERRKPPEPKPEPYRPGGKGEKDMFVLTDTKKVVSTKAGRMNVVLGYGESSRVVNRPLHIGFITMEPRSLFIPQYVDSSLILFVRRGEAKIGLIYDYELRELKLKAGDVYRIPPGSAFYIVNTGETQRLHIICSIDPSEGLGTFQSFFVGGGADPVSVLNGFDHQTLSTAFNVTVEKLKDFMTKQDAGPIIFADTTHAPSLWANFLKLKEEERLERLKMVAPNAASDEEKEKPKKSWWGIFDSLLGTENKKGDSKGDSESGSSPDSYNIFNKDPSFKNSYGWSIAVDKQEYKPLKKSGVGIYLVNLTAGSMMAPHVNPTATEYGVVLSGVGTIQVVFPNGTSATNTKVKEGDVFLIPRYFPFCQIASRSGPFVFFGFTTSAHKSQPQFLAGTTSILRTMRGPEVATAFGLTEDKYNEIVDAQREAVILPSPSAAMPGEEGSESKGEEKRPDERSESEKGENTLEIEKMPKFIRSLGPEMIMGFE